MSRARTKGKNTRPQPAPAVSAAQAARPLLRSSWGDGVPPTSANPFGCSCGGDHSRKRGEEKVQPIEDIIAASEEAQHALEYKEGLSTWVRKLTAAAGRIGVPRVKGFWEKLAARLEELKRDELRMQMRSTAITPRDAEGGIHHGWMRGRVEEAQYRIERANTNLRELQEYEEKQAAKQAAKAKR